MEITQLENQKRIILYPYEYEELLANAQSLRPKLVLRLGGEAGLRIAETAETKIEHIEILNREESDVSFLYVPEFDPTGQSREAGRPRSVYLPSDVHDLIKEYANEAGIEPNEDLFPVTKRTLQEDVKEVAIRTAESTGNDDFEDVSSQDLRAYFARNMVENHRVHPEVIMKMGGWGGYKTMAKYLNDADEDLIVDEYHNAGII